VGHLVLGRSRLRRQVLHRGYRPLARSKRVVLLGGQFQRGRCRSGRNETRVLVITPRSGRRGGTINSAPEKKGANSVAKSTSVRSRSRVKGVLQRPEPRAAEQTGRKAAPQGHRGGAYSKGLRVFDPEVKTPRHNSLLSCNERSCLGKTPE